MVGDTTHDLQTAVNAGTHGLAVGYRAHPAAALNGASTVSTIGSHGHISAHLPERSQADSDHDRIPARYDGELIPPRLERQLA